MNDIEKQAAFYRGYLPGDGSVAAVAVVLLTGVATWLLLYLVTLVGPAPGAARPATAANYTISVPASR
jgi:hypothetical protein